MIKNTLKKKKIFIFTQSSVTDTVGGAITVFINMCNFLSENYDVTGCCRGGKNQRPEKLNNNVNFVNLKYKYVGYDLNSSLKKYFSKNKPDLIIIFFPVYYPEICAIKEVQFVPKILMFHSRPDYYFYVEDDIEERMKSNYQNTTAQILFPSFKNLLPDFIKNNNVVYIPNFIDEHSYRTNPDKENKKIIYLSRIDNFKGHDFLLKSFALIAQKYPDWEIDVYGQSQPPNYVFQLKDMAEKLGLTKQVHFKGITQKPLETFANYDFCVFPSLFEGTPLGVLEAQSCGLPTVGLKGCTGVNELVKDNENGFLTERTESDFAQKIEILINNRELRKKFGEKALENASQYTTEKVMKKWNILIDEVINYKEISNNIYGNENKYEIFKLNDFINVNKFEYKNFFQRIFSVRNHSMLGKKYKIITVFGIKIKIYIKSSNIDEGSICQKYL